MAFCIAAAKRIYLSLSLLLFLNNCNIGDIFKMYIKLDNRNYIFKTEF